MQFAPREMHSDAAMEKGIPLGRAGTTDEAAGAVYLLCLPEADYITGEVIVGGAAGKYDAGGAGRPPHHCSSSPST